MGTAHYLGEGGAVWTMDLPLPEAIEEKVTKGYLTRVNRDGSPWVEPEAASRPATSAPKAEWIGWAVHVHGLAPDDAEAMTKTDLQELPDAPADEESASEGEE